MRNAGALFGLAVFFAALFGPAQAAAQVDLVPGDYLGKLSGRFYSCTSPDDNGKFSMKGRTYITSTANSTFSGGTAYVVQYSGLQVIWEAAFTGTIDLGGALDGTFVHEFRIPELGYLSNGSGTFTGQATPGKVSMVFAGLDYDPYGECGLRVTLKGKGPPGPFACDAARMKAVAKQLGATLSAHGTYTRNPSRDPGAVKRDARIAKAAVKLGMMFDKASERAAKKGGTCNYTGLPEDLAGQVLAFADTLRQQVTNGVNNDIAQDRSLRATLIKLASRLASSTIKAEAKFALKPNLAKRDKALAKARAGFLLRADKALAKAANKPGTYTGVATTDLADDVNAFVGDMTSSVH